MCVEPVWRSRRPCRGRRARWCAAGSTPPVIHSRPEHRQRSVRGTQSEHLQDCDGAKKGPRATRLVYGLRAWTYPELHPVALEVLDQSGQVAQVPHLHRGTHSPRQTSDRAEKGREGTYRVLVEVGQARQPWWQVALIDGCTDTQPVSVTSHLAQSQSPKTPNRRCTHGVGRSRRAPPPPRPRTPDAPTRRTTAGCGWTDLHTPRQTDNKFFCG
jgi:hypothetical protein